MIANPLDAHTQGSSEGSSIHERRRRDNALTLLEELDHTKSHSLDQILGKHHPEAPDSV